MSFDSENPPVRNVLLVSLLFKKYSYHLLFLFPPICVLFSDKATRLANFLSLNSTHPSVKVLFFFSVEVFSEIYQVVTQSHGSLNTGLIKEVPQLVAEKRSLQHCGGIFHHNNVI